MLYFFVKCLFFLVYLYIFRYNYVMNKGDYMDNSFKNKNIAVIVLELFIILLGVGGITFATSKLMGSRTNTVIKTGVYSLNYIENENVSNNLEPISDNLINIDRRDNVMRISFSLKGVKENSRDDLIYDVMLKNISIDNSLLNKYTKWNLYKNGILLSSGNFDPSFDGDVLSEYYYLTTSQESLKNYDDEFDEYVFLLWISEACNDLLNCEYFDQGSIDNSSIMMDIFIAVYAGEKNSHVRHDSYDKSNANRPTLFDGMIPVRYKNGNLVVVSSDNSSSNPWYDYSKLEYANAIILKSGNYKIGDIINEDDILEQFVWIPRYAYKLWNVNSEVTDSYKAYENGIDIVFVNGISNNGYESSNFVNDMYIIHPAFNNMRGFWITKNETTESDENTLVSSYKAKNGHMINNLEWGSIMYLTNSKYGNLYYTSSTGNEYGINDINTSVWEKVKVNNEIGSATKEIMFADGTNWDNSEAITSNDGYYLRNGFAYKPFSNNQEYKTRYVFFG